MSKVKFYLTSDEANLLKRFGLSTPAEVIDYYRRTKARALRELYLKTVGAYSLIA